MDSRTRSFVLGSAGLLAVGLCTGLVAYYTGFSMPAPRGQALQELRHIPEDVAALAYVNLRDVMASELRERVRALDRHESRGHEALRERTGIDIETDIDHIVACWPVARAGTAGNGHSVLMVMRGRFDVARLEAATREHGGDVGEYRGRRMLGVTEGALLVVEPGLVLVGDRELVRQAYDRQDGGPNVTSNQDVMRLVDDVAGRSSAWVVIGRLDELARRARIPEGVADQIPAVQWLTAAGRINGGVEALVRAEARDVEAAQNLRDVLQGFLALARLQSGARPEFAAVLQSLELSGSGRTVSLSFSIPAAALDSLGASPAAPGL